VKKIWTTYEDESSSKDASAKELFALDLKRKIRSRRAQAGGISLSR